MAALVITSDQRSRVEAMASALHNALGYGVSDGGTLFIEAMTSYLDKLPAALQVKVKEFMEAAFAASMSSGAFEKPPALFISEAEYGLACSGNYTSVTDSATTAGNVLVVTGAAKTLTGVKFWWPGAYFSDVKVSLWNSTIRLAEVTVICSTEGVYTATFSSPQTLSPYTEYRITRRDQSETYRWHATNANISTQTGALLGAADFYGLVGDGWKKVTGCHSTTGADTYPDVEDASNIYLIDPIFL